MQGATILGLTAALVAGLSTSSDAEARRGTEDYPLEASQKHEQGAVLVDVTIGADGRITACSVAVSGNSPQLDEATCKIFLTRAKFVPAQDAKGQPIAQHMLGRVDWVIPGCKAPPQTDSRLAKVEPSLTITSLKGC